MRLIAWIVAAGVLAPAALAFPAQEGQGEKKEEKQEKKAPEPAAGEARGPGAAFEAKDYEELGAYSDSLAAAELDDETTGELLVSEVRGRMMRGRARGPGPGPGAGAGDSPPAQAGAARPEPLSTFVKSRIAEGKKGAELAGLIKAEMERRRSEMPGGGAGYGAGAGRGPEFQKAMREANAGIVKKLRAEKLAGKAFAEAFVKEHRAQADKMREERRRERGETPEKPRDGA